MPAPTPGQRRMTLLYQLYLASQASRRFMRLALAGTPFSGEEYALYSYLNANGPRTLTRTARDLGMPLTTLATLVNPLVEGGQLERRLHPRDGRARLLSLSDPGRERLLAAIPHFAAAYQLLLADLEASGTEIDELFGALDALKASVERAVERLESGDEVGRATGVIA
jgi:DNA-binding MarR family transcriptional regulator